MFCADSHNNDEVGKSVAIIVGVFGGLAVLVVLLSICKKAAGNHFAKIVILIIIFISLMKLYGDYDQIFIYSMQAKKI